MTTEKEWETRSLEWIHKVREEMDAEIRESGMTRTQWITKRAAVDTAKLCNSLNLNNVRPMEKAINKLLIPYSGK